MASDISPFEVNHSGLIRSLLNFLTRSTDSNRDDRLRAFLHIFASCPVRFFSDTYTCTYLNLLLSHSMDFCNEKYYWALLPI